MSGMHDLDLPSSSIDAESFLPALAAGELDRCLVYLIRRDSDAQSDAGLNCRLAEGLLHESRGDEAVECVRRALPWAGGDAAMLRICAWVFRDIRSISAAFRRQ